MTLEAGPNTSLAAAFTKVKNTPIIDIWNACKESPEPFTVHTFNKNTVLFFSEKLATGVCFTPSETNESGWTIGIVNSPDPKNPLAQGKNMRDVNFEELNHEIFSWLEV